MSVPTSDWSSLCGRGFAGADQLADDLLDRLSALAGGPLTAKSWPSVPCALVAKEWERARLDVIEPYFAARVQLAAPAENG